MNINLFKSSANSKASKTNQSSQVKTRQFYQFNLFQRKFMMWKNLYNVNKINNTDSRHTNSGNKKIIFPIKNTKK